jgi:hypothetical protein
MPATRSGRSWCGVLAVEGGAFAQDGAGGIGRALSGVHGGRVGVGEVHLCVVGVEHGAGAAGEAFGRHPPGFGSIAAAYLTSQVSTDDRP